jgi:hypothetical protein
LAHGWIKDKRGLKAVKATLLMVIEIVVMAFTATKHITTLLTPVGSTLL